MKPANFPARKAARRTAALYRLHRDNGAPLWARAIHEGGYPWIESERNVRTKKRRSV